jgi:hypothetical protein
VALFGLLGGLVLAARRRGREVSPGTLVGVFALVYGVCRLITDSFRVNDERVAGMTGAQWMCLVMVAAGAWILVKVRPRLAALDAEEVLAETAPDTLAAPDDEAEAEGDASSGTAGAGAVAGVAAGEAGEAREGERWRTAATKMSALLDPEPGAAASDAAASDDAGDEAGEAGGAGDAGGTGDAGGAGDPAEPGAPAGDRGDAGDERS